MAGSMTSTPFAVPQCLADSTVLELKSLCAGRKLNATGNKADLIVRLEKHETQPRVYDGMSLSSLLKEAKSRRLNCAAANSSVDLIAMLEAADRALTFGRFLDLPAELRNRIYRYATVSEPSVALVRPYVPAICQASSQLRSESLPIYYGVNSFAMQLRAAVYERKPQHRVKLMLESRLDGKDDKWLKMLEATGTAKYLRRLLVVVAKTECGKAPYTCTEVKLTGGMTAYELINRGIWEACTGLARLATVDGHKHAVALPSDLTAFLHGIVQNGRAMEASAVAEILQCFLKGSGCYIKR
ncbi:hypothetical protein LTR85_010366 [Meristemomyces frigidus]|nr:hypothetical protein LTR85_010366 [Meristemomyces frigidus]